MTDSSSVTVKWFPLNSNNLMLEGSPKAGNVSQLNPSPHSYVSQNEKKENKSFVMFIPGVW